MDDLYDTKYLEWTIDCISDELNSLETWSVHNDDTNLDEIIEFKAKWGELKRKLKERG